ncbi:ABC transporter substrate-binding protein [Methanospirillum lacunae]|uniref:ABC transporter substrate-binding protein n=1 Tax=Methanospirillum lacunae TaxID=668570 RepID=A0A2V2MYL0_9EURY|nr:ABC transporter substrate-binding protein [Methanospirillum lacunae]PWR72539.1 ABC transporter substrate-binding protein [Methanospirillum lacunae]
MVVYLALDDTDMPDSIGTGRLARFIADEMGKKYPVLCVTRHQFYVHPDIPYTSHNSGAVIHFADIPPESESQFCDEAIALMREKFILGSDPGLCFARHEQIIAPVITFGQDAKTKVLTQDQARKLAYNLNIFLIGLGGTNGGIIGALAGVGLAATGCDGRFLLVGTIRSREGDQEVKEILKTGIEEVLTIDGRVVTDGMIRIRKFPQPVRIMGRPVLLVEELEGELIAVKRD